MYCIFNNNGNTQIGGKDYSKEEQLLVETDCRYSAQIASQKTINFTDKL